MTYPELTGTNINTIVNDFFTSYYSPNSTIQNKLPEVKGKWTSGGKATVKDTPALRSLKQSFKIYAKNKKIPVDNDNLDGNKSIYAQIEATYKGIKNSPRVLALTKQSTKKVLHTKVNLLPQGRDRVEDQIAMTQKVLHNDGRLMMFSNKKISTNEAVKIGSNMQKYYGVDEPVVVTTPYGTISIIPKGKDVAGWRLIFMKK